MQQKFDAQWYPKMQDSYILDTQWLNDFSTVSSKERIKFLENEVENPVFKNSAREDFDFSKSRKYWQEFMHEVNAKEPNDVVQSLYVHKIEAQLHRVQMIEASLQGDDQLFTEKSLTIYGKPKKKYFCYIAKRMQDLLEESSTTSHQDAYKHIKKIFSKIDASKVAIQTNVLPAPVEDSAFIETAEEVALIFKSLLKKYKVSDWKIEMDVEVKRRIFAINPQRHIIYIPATRYLLERKKQLTKTGVSALAEHEIGVHVVRSWRGSQQPLHLLSLGLQGYLRGEEGVASYRQQLVEGANEYYGFDRYLAASLVYGLDGKPRDFRGLFEILQDYYLLTLPESEDILDRARNGAWNTCLRIFRGTTGQGEGYLFTRDINYLEGNIGIWQLLTAEPSWQEYLTIGKYDPLNKNHVLALRELEILPG